MANKKNKPKDKQPSTNIKKKKKKKKTEENSDAQEGKTVPAPHVAPAVLLLFI